MGSRAGNSALLFTFPKQWAGDNFLILNGGEPLLNDTADYPYLLVDVTTLGGPDTPDEGPIWRQMFGIFNNNVTGFYDSNPDNDNQHDFPAAGFADGARTETIVIDMTGPDPAVNDDDKNFLNLKAQQGASIIPMARRSPICIGSCFGCSKAWTRRTPSRSRW